MRPSANPPVPRPQLPAESVRMFFALWPDSPVRDALAALARDVAARTEGRAPPRANLHVTVAFVGDVARARVADLCAIGAAVAADASPFTLTLDRTGTFRGTGITWAGTASIPVALEQLAMRLYDALAAHGFAIERRAFTPHVTLARRCRRSDDVAIAVPIVWHAAQLALNVSEAGSGGPRYRAIETWPLDLRASGSLPAR